MQNNIVYHGTAISSLNSIINGGIDMSKSAKGYFGVGFYTTPDLELAKENYANFSDDAGVVLSFKVNGDARILDLANSKDWEIYKSLSYRGVGVDGLLSRDDFDSIMRGFGIDGIKDESFGGTVFYNTNSLKFYKIEGDIDVE